MKALQALYSVLAILLSAQLLLAQETTKKETNEGGLPLGTTWYYSTDEREFVDHPYRFGYIRHRVERNVELSGYQVQEISAINVDYTGKESELEPLYLYRDAGKRYLLEDGKLRLLYDTDAEVGDLVPLPPHPEALEMPGFVGVQAQILEKKLITINGRELIRQLYEIRYIFENDESNSYHKVIPVIEDFGVGRLDELYATPIYYFVAADFFINPYPLLRCFSSDDYFYKSPDWINWGDKDCDFYGYITSQTDINSSNKLSLAQEDGILWLNGLDQNGSYSIFGTDGKMMQSGEVLAEGKINVSALPLGLYILRVNTKERNPIFKFHIH